MNSINYNFNKQILSNSSYGNNISPKPIQNSNEKTITHPRLQTVKSNLALVYFGKLIPSAKRLSQSNYAISAYIAEIGKARWLYGDKSVIDLSMGNPDLTPPKKAQES